MISDLSKKLGFPVDFLCETVFGNHGFILKRYRLTKVNRSLDSIL